MENKEILELIIQGETSFVQFKQDVKNATSIAQEMVAFSNSEGGKLLIGIDDKTGEIIGLSFQDIQRINSLLTTAANEHVKSPISIQTQTFDIDGKKMIIATIPKGLDKPYMDKDGIIFTKNGSDKRKVTSKNELRRLLQSSESMYAEEIILQNSTYKDIDIDKFEAFFIKKYKSEFEKENLGQYLENMSLAKDGKLNLAGALLFSKFPYKNSLPFFISAVWFKGYNKWETEYWSSDNFRGTLVQQYESGYSFIINSLTKLQAGQSFNSVGISEIPEIVIQELLTNALIHRDYFINDTIKIFIFLDRIEIISPGTLPNNLDEQKIKRGIRKKRNPVLDSFAMDVLNYKGIGSGIVRCLQIYPDIEFINDKEAEEFKVIIKKPKLI